MLQKTEYQNSSKFRVISIFQKRILINQLHKKTEYDSFNRNQYDNSFNFNKIKQTPFKNTSKPSLTVLNIQILIKTSDRFDKIRTQAHP